jgi:outer membrane protein TolC
LIASVLLSGCHPIQPCYFNEDGDLSHYLDVATEIEHADVDLPSLADVEEAKAPLTITRPEFDEIWELCLEDAISIALANSKVVRQIRARGGVFQLAGAPTPDVLTLNAGLGVPTIYDPALQETSQGGVEQALAAFDAQLSTSIFWDRTDRPQNVSFGNRFQRDQVTGQTEISKQAATGTQFFFRGQTIYDDTPIIPGIGISRPLEIEWFRGLEFEARQPLLRGRGSQVNRIPVVIARIQTDIALHDFEANVRDLVSDVERSYWTLYFAYRNLEATKIGRNSALATWKRIYTLYEVGGVGGEAENEAQSREQYFFFRARLEDALNILFKSEKQLRYLLGLAHTDGRLIRPCDEPTTAKVAFEWADIHSEALVRAPELRRQKWVIKQRELELIAARNQLLPQLDMQALYRFLGFGNNLFGDNPPGSLFPDENTSAWDELFGGNYQEGRLGFQLVVPLGYRVELAQVRNRQLALAREKAVYEDMELEVSHQLADAIQDLEAEYTLTQSNLNRIRAAVREVESIQAAYDAGAATLDRLLDAQRRRSDAEVTYYQSLADFNLAIMQVHFRKGSLLDHDGIVLAEGPWPAKAYYDAHNLARRRDASYYLNYGYSRPKVVSRGPEGVPAAATDPSAQSGVAQPQDQDSGADQAEPLQLEPLPAPQPAELPMPQQPRATTDISLPMPAAANASGPVLAAPRLSVSTRNRPATEFGGEQKTVETGQVKNDPQVSVVGFVEDPLAADDQRAFQGTSIMNSPSSAVGSGIQSQPARRATRLQWKGRAQE